MEQLTPEILRFVRLLDWDSRTGKLYWKPRTPEMYLYEGHYPKKGMAQTFNKRFAGKEAFTAVGNHGYKVGTVDGRYLLAHRLLWVLEYNWWPEGFVDHINGIRTDNRLVNLRAVDNRESARNTSVRVGSTSGCNGVTWRKDPSKWHSRITVDGKVEILGDFNVLEDAIAIRKEKEAEYGFHKNHGRPNTRDT